MEKIIFLIRDIVTTNIFLWKMIDN